MKYNCACVTGSSSGIGKALAIALAGKGIPLLITGRNEAVLKELSEQLSTRVPISYVVCDLQDPASRKELIEKIKVEECDLIINNAGLGYFGDALNYTTEEQLEVMRVNNEALVEITLETARHLKESKKPGTFLNISSVAAHFIFPFHTIYSATKAFVNRFSLALDTELKPHGIRVLTSCPGLVKSRFHTRCTKGKAQTTPESTYMTSEHAARIILNQIKHTQRVVTFNFSFRLFSWIARLLPSSFLYSSMKRRYNHLFEG